MKNIITGDNFAEFSEKINSVFDSNNLTCFLSDKKIDNFFTMSRLLTEFNLHTNLTAITDIEGITRKHIADSLLGAQFFPNGAKVIDIGTGGGFPSLPLAIAREDLKILAVDSTAKKLKFVDLVASELSLSNISSKCGRAEEIIADSGLRAGFDCVCARAVAQLAVLAELCVPFLKVGGKFIAYKGADGESEWRMSRNAAKLLGCDSGNVYEKHLRGASGDFEVRTFIVYTKISATDCKYPRKYAQIKSAPL